MSKIKLDNNLIKIISMFQSVTGIGVKDCIDTQDRMIFVVEERNIDRAVGKSGEKVRRMEKSLNRKIKIVGFNPVLTEFVRNLIYPYRALAIKEEGRTLVITPADSQTRGRLIGRGASTLREFERITKRYFDIDEIKIT